MGKAQALKKSQARGGAVLPTAVLTDDQVRAMPERDYMGAAQLAFFRARLNVMRDDIIVRQSAARAELDSAEHVFADVNDRATAEEERMLALRLRERENFLLKKIADALRRINDGSYGYCETTGDPIGVARLLARPTANVCVQVKDRDERVETHFRT